MYFVLMKRQYIATTLMNVQALEEILRQVLDSRRRQDSRLAESKRQSGILVLSLLTIGALVSDASFPLDSQTNFPILLTLASAGINGALWFFLHLLHHGRWKWQEDIDIREMHSSAASNDSYPALLKHLIERHECHRVQNDKMLRLVRIVSYIQAVISVSAIAFLLLWIGQHG